MLSRPLAARSLPQHIILLSVSRAHEWWLPRAILFAVMMLETSTGVVRSMVVALQAIDAILPRPHEASRQGQVTSRQVGWKRSIEKKGSERLATNAGDFAMF